MAKHKALLDRYPEPQYADGKRLKIVRESLRIGQVELSRLAGLGQDMISRIESGVRPFSKGARNKIWPVMAKLLDERLEEVKSSTPWIRKALDTKSSGEPKSQDKQKHGGLGFLSDLGSRSSVEALKAEWSSLTIEQRLQFEKNLLEGQLQGAREMIAGKDAQIATLIKALDAALQANADYAKLFALKGASVAADELQKEIESRQRKHDDE